MQLPEDFIDRSPEEGARLVALSLLADASAAAARLGTEDPEALHDLRVGLRRLRSTLKLYRAQLTGLGKKLPRKLGELARGTNAARDAEVHLAWLEEHRRKLSGAGRDAGVRLLVERLEARRGPPGARAELAAAYEGLARKLGARLGRFEARVEAVRAAPPFGALLAATADEGLSRLEALLAVVTGPADEEAIHSARIQGKRLRYALEPLRGHPRADAREAVAGLKGLQDVLGELHDTHVLAREVTEALADAEAARARAACEAIFAARGAAPEATQPHARAGLLAVARACRKRRDALYAELTGAWLEKKLPALRAEVHRVTAALGPARPAVAPDQPARALSP